MEISQPQSDSSAARPGESTLEPREVHAEVPPAERARAGPLDPGFTWRAAIIALLLTVACGWWVQQAEIVVIATQISESVPAIPGLAALILVLVLNALLRRTRFIRPFTRGELLAIFIFVTIASSLPGCGIQRFLFALITAPYYFPGKGIAAQQQYLPSWFAPKDRLIIQRLYEGSPNGAVPWQAWWIPMLAWLGFFLALWWAMYCLMALLYRAWSEDERLSFPLVFLPLEMTEPEPGSRALGGGGSLAGSFFRNPIMWAGFALSAGYNLVNILHAFHPAFPDIPKSIDVTASLTDPAWRAIRPITLQLRPELIGLGYLVGTEISFSIWSFYFITKLEGQLAAAYGMPAGQLPYPQEQGIGAYLVLAFLILWLARRHLVRAARMAISGTQPLPVGPQAITYRTAFIGLFLGFAALCAFAWAAGMALWAIVTYMAIVLMVALVFARMRGEAGVPLIWLFPFYMQKNVMLYTLGSQPFLAAGGPATLAVFATLTFMSRGYYPSLIGYELDSMEISRRARIRPRAMMVAVILALIVGFVVGWYIHLAPFYKYGAQQLRDGIWGSGMARQEYTWAYGYLETPKQPEPLRIWATLGGGALAMALSLLRYRYVWFPFHPLGYAMQCSYGELLWFPFFVVWLCKTLVLRYGGMQLYRRSIPGFLGFALGHYAVAGIFWGLLGAFSGEAVRGYAVWFG